MALTDEQYKAIQAYLNNTLTAEEEEAFMQQLKKNAALQEQFNITLLLQHALKEESTSSEFEPADAHIERVKNILEQNENINTSVAPVKEIFPSKKNIIWLAAASVILLMIITFLYQYKTKAGKGNDNIAVHKDSAANKNDTATVQTPGLSDTPVLIAAADPAVLYKEFYKHYQGKDDPVEVSIYLLAYYEKDYDAVINAVEADYQVRSGSPSQAPKEYMQLYQGLSYMELQQYAKAVVMFDSVLTEASATAPQFYAGQWYKALALLADKKTAAAKNIFKEITVNTKSPWRKQAIALDKRIP